MPTRLFFFDRSALTIVRGQDSQLHAHRAVQLTIVIAGAARVRFEHGLWQPLTFFAFEPELAHRIDSRDGVVAHLFLDPGARAYAAWRAAGREPCAPSLDTVESLRALDRDASLADEAARIAWRWESEGLPGWAATRIEPDARIEASLAAVERDPSIAVNHRALAEAAHLSVSRYAERFRAATGMPVRNYLLWRRLLLAVEKLRGGASVTVAAHESGFSDASHLSRSFRRILGATPSDLLL